MQDADQKIIDIYQNNIFLIKLKNLVIQLTAINRVGKIFGKTPQKGE